MSQRLLIAALLLCVSPHAWSEETTEATETEASAPEREAREAELFGDPETDEPDPEAAIFGDEPGLLQDGLDMITRLDEKNDLLQIGGLLYLRLDWTINERGGAETFPLSSPNLLDLYLDARPSDQLRAYVRGRLSHDFTAGETSTNPFGEPRDPTRVTLDQLWLKFDIDRHVFFTVGQQPIRWGHGRFWNPTDFLNRSFKDPLAVFDERRGVALVKVHVPIESLGWNFYAIADLDQADTADKIGVALRGEFLVGTTEIATSFAARRDTPYRLGLSVSSGFWLIDAWAEVALLYDVRTPRWEGSFDLETFTVPTARDVSDTWWPRASFGFEIGIPVMDEDVIYLGVEYAYNALGYDDATLYPWLASEGALVPFYTGKHYAALYAMLPSPGRWDDVTFILNHLANLSDNSYILRFDTRMRVMTYLDLNFYVAAHYGDLGEFHYGIRVPPTPGIEGLEQGIDVAPPLLDIGVGLRLRL